MAYKEPPIVTLTPAPTPLPTSSGSSSGIGGAVVNGVFGLGQALLNNQFAKNSAKKQYERQLEFWNMQNEYNSPGAQRKRLMDAGFNPASVVGEVASGQQAGELSSVPGNEYAQTGVLRLEGLAQTLEIMSRIEKLGAETGLLTSQMTTEALQQTLLGLGIDKAEVEYIITQYEAQAKEMELENLPYFYEHTRNMYSLEESYKSAQIEHENALKSLADAQSDESRASAQKLVAETGLTELKYETERSIQSLNYYLSTKAKYEGISIKEQAIRERVLFPLKRRALELANKAGMSEADIAKIESASAKLAQQLAENRSTMYMDENGQPTIWAYCSEFLNTVGEVIGVALVPSVGGAQQLGRMIKSSKKIGF